MNIELMRSLPATFPTRSYPPLVHPLVMGFIQDQREQLLNLSNESKQSFHVSFPEIFLQNMSSFSSTLVQHGVRHTVLYAAKVSRENSFLRYAGPTDFGVDVASQEEMREAMASGVTGNRICLSGPFKRDDFVSLARSAGALVTIDCLEELARIETLCSKFSGNKLDVLLRWTGRTGKKSRFGMNDVEVHEAVARIKKNGTKLRFKGLAFHLRGYDVSERSNSLDQAIDLLHSFQIPEADTINIGGGFPVRYVSQSTWIAARDDISQNGDKGVYPAWCPVAGHECIEAILNTALPESQTIKSKLVGHNIRLLLEPGRSALDQAAISVFRVIGVRKSISNPSVVYVAGNCLSMSERIFDCEVWYDPILIKARNERRQSSIPVLIAGNSCLEDDLFSSRTFNLSSIPDEGDLLIFANTAAYQMDFAESSIHRMPLPQKYFATVNAVSGTVISPSI